MTDLTTLAHMLETGVAGPEAQAAAAAEIKRMRKQVTTPRTVIEFIAGQAAQTGALANVGGMETAGSIISTLAANPELIDEYMNAPAATFVSKHLVFRPENGALSWHRKDTNEVITPAEARCLLGKADN
jgi:hypothetical protein